MTLIIVTCVRCGAEFQPDRDAVVAGAWRTCPECSVGTGEPHRCRECGRPLRLTSRALCAQCLGISL
jgi:DNA-directed RNA polymerase subunit RPC12/RpoP